MPSLPGVGNLHLPCIDLCEQLSVYWRKKTEIWGAYISISFHFFVLKQVLGFIRRILIKYFKANKVDSLVSMKRWFRKI